MSYKTRSINEVKKMFPENTRFLFEDFLISTPFSMEYLRRGNRKREVMQWRQVGMTWAAIEHHSVSKAGKLFERDHATCIHALKKVVQAMEGYDKELKDKIDTVTNCIEFSVPHSNDASENEKNSLIYLEQLIKKKLAAEGLLIVKK